MPLTAPRTKLFDRTLCTPGHNCGEVVALPIRGPGRDDEEQPDLDEQRDDEQPPEQELPPHLDAPQPLDAGRHIAVAPNVGVQLGEDRQCARVFSKSVQHVGEIV